MALVILSIVRHDSDKLLFVDFTILIKIKLFDHCLQLFIIDILTFPFNTTLAYRFL